MSSAATRVAVNADRRSAPAGGVASSDAGGSSSTVRPARMSAQSQQHGFKGERSDPRQQQQNAAGPSPQGGVPQTLFTSTSHKRTASGNPRPVSRTANADDLREQHREHQLRQDREQRDREQREREPREREGERVRRTERTTITTKETLVTRTRSPDRRSAAAAAAGNYADKAGKAAEQRQRSAAHESRPRESKPIELVLATPWSPEVSLIPHTSAPLASRISIPPLASLVPASKEPRPLHEMTLEIQEAVILEDLLFVFMGYEGQYIRFARTYDPTEERDRLSGPEFRILPGLDPSLQDLAMSMLKMATYYSALGAFVDVQSREEFGSVNHALCASVRKFLQDYLIMIAQLETQFLTNDAFTLHVLNIHTLPTSQMMFQLYSLAHELLKRNSLLDDESDDSSSGGDEDDYENILQQLRDGIEGARGVTKKLCKGGGVLGLLSKRLQDMSGDASARALLTTLLRDASRPYMKMLNEWLHHGAINDPHAEFLVKEQKSIGRESLERDYTDEYWERRYTVREQDVPPQLEGVKDKVLLAGKYLNVVRECGGVDVSKGVDDVPTSFDDAQFLANVNSAYAHANESLMQLLLTAHQLSARLQSMKHYFFLDPSDYFSYFLELGASELRKPVKSVNTAKLQSLLDLVLRQPGSVVSLDPFKEDVKVEMKEISLTKDLQRVVNITGIEQGETLPSIPTNAQQVEADKSAIGFSSLQLDYAVPFPVSLVIGRKTVWRYQALFRYLLSLRYLESQLSTTWQTHMRGTAWSHRSRQAPRLEIWKRRVWTLRARMLVFVQQLIYFCTAEVIEKNWQALMARLKGEEAGANGESSGPTRTVDELMKDHVNFLDSCLKECMLTNSKLLRIHSKIMQTCTFFAAYTSWLSRELEKTDPDLSGSTRPPDMTEKEWRHFLETRPSSSKTTAAGGTGPNDSQSSGSGQSDEERIANLFEIIKKWETNFSRHLQILLDALNHYGATETIALLSLCARLSTANQGTEYAGRIGGDEMSV